MIEDDVMIINVGVYIGDGGTAVVYDCEMGTEASRCVL